VVENIAKQFIDYIPDELVNAPSIWYAAKEATIPRDLALKYVDMYQDEVIKDLRRRGIKPLDARELEERVYALYEGGVAYVGKGIAGELYLEKLVPSSMLKNAIAFLHTHPIPLPVPTPEDLASAANLGYRVECVASRIGCDRARITCVEPKRDWDSLIEACSGISKVVLSVSEFIVVANDDSVFFVPLPTENELNEITKRFVKALKPIARVSIVDVWAPRSSPGIQTGVAWGSRAREEFRCLAL